MKTREGALEIALVDTVTLIEPRHRDAILITGSHGGGISAFLAAMGGARAAVFNDAGGGLDDAGFSGLRMLDSIGMAAITVAHASARIADAQDTLSNGIVSHVNGVAAQCGVREGMRCARAALALRRAPRPQAPPPPYPEARKRLRRATSEQPGVWGLDSLAQLKRSDGGRLLVIGSAGGLPGGRPEAALPVDAAAAIFHDGGRGKGGAALMRLPALAARGIPAACVDGWSARIGEARSIWDTGRLSALNAVALASGWQVGERVPDALARPRVRR